MKNKFVNLRIGKTLIHCRMLKFKIIMVWLLKEKFHDVISFEKRDLVENLNRFQCK